MPSRVIFLPSGDGQDYAMVVFPPSNMSDARAKKELHKALADIRKNEEWTWDDDLKPTLTKLGFRFPRVIMGPVWDDA